jgi:hypothetical protein
LKKWYNTNTKPVLWLLLGMVAMTGAAWWTYQEDWEREFNAQTVKTLFDNIREQWTKIIPNVK